MTPRLHKAILFAAEAHEGQFRKGKNVPYISHPFSVAAIVANYTKDEDIVIAALFHDVVEDVRKDGFKREDIVEQFGQNVMDVVEGCTQQLLEEENPHLEVKKAYIENLDNVSEDSLFVVCADKVHNTLAILEDQKVRGEEFWNIFQSTKDQTIQFYIDVYEKLLKRIPDAEILKEYKVNVEEMKKLR